MVTETEIKKDDFLLKVVFEGKREELDGGLARKLDTELKSKTGLDSQGVEYTPAQSFAVRLPAVGKSVVYEGTSTESIDDAIHKATKGGTLEFNQNRIGVTLERTAQVPFFIVPLTVRSLYPDQAKRNQASAVGELKHTYGSRLNPDVDEATYTVYKTSKAISKDKDIPQGEISSVVSRAKTSVSMEESIARASNISRKEKARVKTTVYEIGLRVKIYGQQERSLTAPATSAAKAATVATPSSTSSPASSYSTRRSGGRAASPRGLEPAYMESTAELM